MTIGFGGRRRRPTREQLEQEAADVIAKLVAEGRPPPEVWRKADDWRAANPPSGTSWYAPDDPAAAHPASPPVPVVSAKLIPRAVRLPSAVYDQQRGEVARPARPTPVEDPVAN